MPGGSKDQGKLEPAHISMLKRNNVAMALECARLSRDLLGANGITDEYPIMRHLCNLETVKTYEGTDHIHALVIGEKVTGVRGLQVMTGAQRRGVEASCAASPRQKLLSCFFTHSRSWSAPFCCFRCSR